MATRSRMPLLWACPEFGNGGPNQRRYPEAASQTFKKGMLVYSSSGYVTGVGNVPTQLLGVAAEDAHNDTVAGTSKVLVWAIEGNVFKASICSEAADNGAAPGNGTITQTDLHQWLSLYRDTTNNLHLANRNYLNSATAGKQIFKIVDFYHAVGDVNGIVLVKINGQFSQTGVTS